MSSESIRDEVIILRVKEWQTADKYVIAFSRNYGKIRFIAYGARYVKNTAGRLLQPFACLTLEVTQGQKLERLKSCELLRLPQTLDFKQMAYGAVAAELTEAFTEDRAPQEELYELLTDTLNVMTKRNPRLVVLAYALKLLALSGFAPQTDACVTCGKAAMDDEDCLFSPLQGGLVCKECGSGGEEAFSAGTRKLLTQLQTLDLQNPQSFTVRGENLMELEKLLYKFILFQTDKPLNSLNFLSQMGL